MSVRFSMIAALHGSLLFTPDHISNKRLEHKPVGQWLKYKMSYLALCNLFIWHNFTLKGFYPLLWCHHMPHLEHLGLFSELIQMFSAKLPLCRVLKSSIAFLGRELLRWLTVLCHHKSVTFLRPLEKAQAGKGWGSCQVILVGIQVGRVCGESPSHGSETSLPTPTHHSSWYLRLCSHTWVIS